jgi:putative transposase
MVKKGFTTILLRCQRLHVKEYHKTKKCLSYAGQAMEVIKKAPAQKATSEEAGAASGQQSGCSGWHLARTWTGCQWKSIEKEWFNVSSSDLHERFQTWQASGLFELLFKKMVKYYARERKIGWKWQSIDSMMSPAPLGGWKTGKNPTDRGKLGSKVHLLVDERGAPLAIYITGANEHDKWSADDLIIHIVTKRPHSEQHFCADKGYDYEDVHQFVGLYNYIEHIKHRRKRNEPIDECAIPGEKSFPARRWVIERTLGWLAKRRSIATRWCKKSENWLAFVHMACAQILLNIIFG